MEFRIIHYMYSLHLITCFNNLQAHAVTYAGEQQWILTYFCEVRIASWIQHPTHLSLHEANMHGKYSTERAIALCNMRLSVMQIVSSTLSPFLLK